MNTETVNLSQIQVNGSNPRTITDSKFEKLINSILALPKMLEIRPIVVDDTYTALGGNMRYRALTAISDMTDDELTERLMGIRDVQKKTQAEQDNLSKYWLQWKDKPTVIVIKASELSDEEQKEFIIKDNVGFGDWDMDALANEWDNQDLIDWGVDVWNGDADGIGGGGADDTQNSQAENSLSDRFVVPPFSVFDARMGYWQLRKKIWRRIIGDMGQSRQSTLVKSLELRYKDLYTRSMKHRKELGITFKEYLDKYVSDEVKEHEEKKVLTQGVSILDPVMAEIICKWFCQEHGKTFDCFAGDSVFGYVSAYLGYDFTGVELRDEQAALNNERVQGMTARYICDDGQNVANHIEPESQDLLFSCPPYYNLEKYSDLPNDASNQGTYEDFIAILKNAFTASVRCLKNNRFAVICLGDIRNKDTGYYYDFCGSIKNIFREAGMNLYNEIILIENPASAALRASKCMESRKVVKTHQNILVFYKGDTKRIRDNFKKIEYASEDLELFRVDSGDESADDSAEI
jgi:hypothetical protein